jgi:hypothetical protein
VDPCVSSYRIAAKFRQFIPFRVFKIREKPSKCNNFDTLVENLGCEAEHSMETTQGTCHVLAFGHSSPYFQYLDGPGEEVSKIRKTKH